MCEEERFVPQLKLALMGALTPQGSEMQHGQDSVAIPTPNISNDGSAAVAGVNTAALQLREADVIKYSFEVLSRRPVFVGDQKHIVQRSRQLEPDGADFLACN